MVSTIPLTASEAMCHDELHTVTEQAQAYLSNPAVIGQLHAVLKADSQYQLLKDQFARLVTQKIAVCRTCPRFPCLSSRLTAPGVPKSCPPVCAAKGSPGITNVSKQRGMDRALLTQMFFIHHIMNRSAPQGPVSTVFM